MTAPGELPNTILAILAGGACMTIDQLDASLPLNRRQISNGAAKLILRGYAERVEAGCYQLTPAGQKALAAGIAITSGPRGRLTGGLRKAPRDTLRQRAWTAMRVSRAFTIGDIAMAAAGAADTAPELNVQRYLHRLKTAGYVVELPVRARGTALTSNGFKRFRLLKDTGPLAPVWSDTHGVMIDRNGERS